MKFKYDEWGLIITGLKQYAGALSATKMKGADNTVVDGVVEKLQKIIVKIETSNLG